MEQIQYVGEHLFYGQFGRLCIFIVFASAILSCFSFFRATQGKLKNLDDGASAWHRLGHVSFIIHAIGVITVIGLLLTMMANRYYEYAYVWNHVSDELSMRYLFSAFWEGQEGSFLLWMFWHSILGLIVLFRGKDWTAPVLTVIAGIEIFLASMILGVSFGDVTIGANPFLLLRETFSDPVFNNFNYITMITGNGLNPLLQNYWMTIHPPTLFLGFSSVAIPFGYAIAGLWTRQHKAWLKPVIPWALFSAGILGTGIFMGGAWAYEALTFGGFWAWDPVENTSLVPWLIIVGGVHALLISKNTGYSPRLAYGMLLSAFILILYSTFLTRSGIMGEESVHAFTEMGLEWQLIAFMVFFAGLSKILLFSRWRGITSPKEEEHIFSREFWMFIGVLVLTFSGVLITFTTSIPVYNAVFNGINDLFGTNLNTNYAMPTDPMEHYNRFQIWIALLITLLSGGALLLRYRSSKTRKKLFSTLILSAALATLFTVGLIYLLDIQGWQYAILLWGTFAGIIMNLEYFVRFSKMNYVALSSTVGHVGFAIMLLGIVVYGTKQQFLSKGFFSVSAIEGMSEDEAGKSVLLTRGLPQVLDDYVVTYQKDTLEDFTRTFTVNYQKFDATKSKVIEEFNLFPNVMYSRDFSTIEAANPSTRHYFKRDIYTHVTSLPNWKMDPNEAKNLEDSLNYIEYEAAIGDTFFTSQAYVVVDGINSQPSISGIHFQKNDIAIGAKLRVGKLNTPEAKTVEPVYIIRDGSPFSFADVVDEYGMKFKFTGLNTEKESLRIMVAEDPRVSDFIVLKAIIFPGMNLVWLGGIMTMLGFFIATVLRLVKRKRS